MEQKPATMTYQICSALMTTEGWMGNRNHGDTLETDTTTWYMYYRGIMDVYFASFTNELGVGILRLTVRIKRESVRTFTSIPEVWAYIAKKTKEIDAEIARHERRLESQRIEEEAQAKAVSDCALRHGFAVDVANERMVTLEGWLFGIGLRKDGAGNWSVYVPMELGTRYDCVEVKLSVADAYVMLKMLDGKGYEVKK